MLGGRALRFAHFGYYYEDHRELKTMGWWCAPLSCAYFSGLIPKRWAPGLDELFSPFPSGFPPNCCISTQRSLTRRSSPCAKLLLLTFGAIYLCSKYEGLRGRAPKSRSPSTSLPLGKLSYFLTTVTCDNIRLRKYLL